MLGLGEGTDFWSKASPEERARWEPYRELRSKLKQAVHMSFYEGASGRLERELARERVALTDNLHSRFAELLRDSKATRRSVQQGFVAAIRELRESRQSRPGPLS